MTDVTRVELSPLNNFRDLGGTPTATGIIKTGVIFRSDDVSMIPASEAQSLQEKGLTTIIDLRSALEASHTGRGELGLLNMTYVSVPLSKGAGSPSEFTEILARGIAEEDSDIVGFWYSRTAVEEAEEIVRGLNVISQSSGANLVHCAAGKDRTGVFVAGLLSALGASEETIVADYARSAQAVPAIMARVSASIGHLLGDAAPHFARAATQTDPVSPLLGADPRSMAAMLHKLNQQGGFLRILRDAGLDRQAEEALRERVLDREVVQSSQS